MNDKGRLIDPMPPLLDASPYRARASRAAVPLCKGDNKTSNINDSILPLTKGESRRRRQGVAQPPLLLFCVLSLLLCASCAPARLNPQEAAGKDLYELHCAQCHDMPPPDLLKAPPPLKGLFLSKTLPSGAPATDEQVQRTILEGLHTMPAFNGRLRRDEIWDLIAYLHTLKSPK